MDSRGLLRLIRRHARLIVIAFVICVLLSAVTTALIPRTYTGRATLFLRVQSVNTSLYQRSQFAMQRIQSYPGMLDASDVLSSVISRTGVRQTPEQLAEHLSAESTAGTLLLTVSATAPDARTAADLANAASDALALHVNTLENSQNTTKNSVVLVPQVEATAPPRPTTPDASAILGLGVVGGLVVGLLCALGLERFRPRLLDADDVRRVTGLPLVAQMPSFDRSAGRVEEELAANLRMLGRGRFAPILLLLPAGSGVDAGASSRGLARGVAGTGRRVLLVGADAPAPGQEGLNDLLGSTVQVGQVVRHADDGIDVVSAGGRTSVPSSFELDSAFSAVVAPLVADHDVTVLRFPLGAKGPDLATVGPFARTALLVVSRRSSSEREVRRVLGALRALDVLPMGVILIDGPRIDSGHLAATWQDGDFLRLGFEDPFRKGRAAADRGAEPALERDPVVGAARSDR